MLYDRQRRYDSGNVGPYLAQILIDADIALVAELIARYDGKARSRHRELAISIMKSLAERGDERCAKAISVRVESGFLRGDDFPARATIKLQGLPAFRDALSIISRLATRSKMWANNLSGVWFEVWDAFGDEFAEDMIRQAGSESPVIAFLHKRLTTRKPELSWGSFEEFFAYAKREKPSRHQYSVFAREASDADLFKAAVAIDGEQDPAVLRGLLHIFRGPRRRFPLDLEILLNKAQHEDWYVRAAAYRALNHYKDPRVRALGKQMIREGKDLDFAIQLFENNLRRGDFEMLLEFARTNAGQLRPHGMFMDIRNLAEKSKSIKVVEALRWCYEEAPCASCRDYTVSHMHKLGAVPAEWLEEMSMDAREDVRSVRALIQPKSVEPS